METKKRVTQKDIARAAGINQSTVSLALRRHPRVAESTREQIENIAAKLGYTPDPMLTALAGYRYQRRVSPFQGTLAWLADSRSGLRWRDNAHFRSFYEFSVQSAAAQGYKMDLIDLEDMKISWSAAGRIAWSRGVQGVIVCPQPAPQANLMEFPWDRFPAVTFGYTLRMPMLHAVCAAHTQIVIDAMERLRRRGYRRIGLVIGQEHERRVNYALSAGYLVYTQQMSSGPSLPVCFYDGTPEQSGALRDWLPQAQPDCILAGSVEVLTTLRSWGMEIPRDLGCLCLALPPGDSPISGMLENTEQMARAAVDILLPMIAQGEQGIPETPRRTLILGQWNEGTTLRIAAPNAGEGIQISGSLRA